MIIGRKSYLFPQISSGLTKDSTDDFIFLNGGVSKIIKICNKCHIFIKQGKNVSTKSRNKIII